MVDGVYDTGSNATLVNYDLIRQFKQKLVKHKSLFKTLGGINFSESRAKLRMKINKIEKVMDVFVIRNSNFSYDILLGLVS